LRTSRGFDDACHDEGNLSSEQQAASSEQRTANSEQRTANSEQRVAYSGTIHRADDCAATTTTELGLGVPHANVRGDHVGSYLNV
jgi:hypothetical protein